MDIPESNAAQYLTGPRSTQMLLASVSRPHRSLRKFKFGVMLTSVSITLLRGFVVNGGIGTEIEGHLCENALSRVPQSSVRALNSLMKEVADLPEASRPLDMGNLLLSAVSASRGTPSSLFSDKD